MSRLKKITIMIIILLIGVIGFSTKSEAFSWNKNSVGKSLYLGYGDYKGSQIYYCVQHGQKLRSQKKKFTVTSYIHIDGNTATDHKNHQKDSRWNAILAYILADKSNNTANKTYDDVANAIWHVIDDWADAVAGSMTGVYDSFVEGKNGSKTYYNNLVKAAEKYADSIEGYSVKEDKKQTSLKIEDKTKRSKLKPVSYTRNGKSYIRVGPFKWKFSGTMKSITATDQNGNKISGLLISKFEGKKEKFVKAKDIASGDNFYISVPGDGSISKITDVIGKAKVNIITADIWFLRCEEDSWQNLIRKDTDDYDADVTGTTPGIDLVGDLVIEKVNSKDHEVDLDGVGFKVQQKVTGKYIKVQNGLVSYVSEAEATEFKTGPDGKFTVKNVIIGDYIAYETFNPHYGYKTLGPVSVHAYANEPGKGAYINVIENEQIYVKLSGFVWVDVPDSKTMDGNDKNALYKQQYNENEQKRDNLDVLFDGIPVRLKDNDGNVIKETVTSKLDRYSNISGHNGHGEFLFMDVLTKELKDNKKYYIEFEYDGLTYQNVIPPYISESNGSKAAEPNRDGFNQNFTYVEGINESDKGITKDSNGNKVYDLGYDISVNHYATLNTQGQYEIADGVIHSTNNNGAYKITSTTTQAGYLLENAFKWGDEEVKFINLGLYEREQPDLELVKDIENVRVDINGYGHIYKYAQRFQHENETYDENGFNVGVKFGKEYLDQQYTQAIYKADYEYVDQNLNDDKNKELEVRIVYRIQVKNRSNNLQARVNSIVDYFDNRYELEGVGTTINENGILVNNSELNRTLVEGNYGKYKKMIIDTNVGPIEAQKSGDIYLQFKLSKEAVETIIDEQGSDNRQSLLDNIAEINSYSIFDNNKIYAGIDENSAPGNAQPEQVDKYENDTESAPALKLEVADARRLNGKVFLDNTTEELTTGNIRQGSGQYEEGEKGISGVKVKFEEKSGAVVGPYEVTTDDNGDFIIGNFIPGDYTLTYTWGDKTYTVQDYKGTVYNKDRYDKNIQNKNWYLEEDENIRLTDAVDDLNQRQQIDDELKNVKYNSKSTITTIDSTTPMMGIGVEYKVKPTPTSENKFVYVINNIDFGIVERARQVINLSKRVSGMKATLANGEVIADLKIDEDGKVTGTRNNVTYMKPDQNSNGFVRLEMDNEIIQGTTLEVEYSIKAINISELDYVGNDGKVSKDFYLHGVNPQNEITINPTEVIDYLDRDWSFDESKNEGVQIIDNSDFEKLVAENVYNQEMSPDTTIANKLILTTQNLSADLGVTNNNEKETTLKVSKQLTATDEISLDNEAETVIIDKTGGSKMYELVPGNYVPGSGSTETDDDIAETTIVTPSTGENQNYIIAITVGISALAILGVGIVLIKKKILK